MRKTDMTELRERLNEATHRARRTGKTDPVSALHKAYIAAFPCAPEVDVSFTSESQTRINPKGAVETETFVTIHATTTEAGAWYMAEILNQLSEENG